MKHSNVSIFIPHNGCPHQCSFCNQKSITGQANQPTADDVRATLEKALTDLGSRAQNAEIAFFGGSFTALDRDYMLTLLRAAKPYTRFFSGIRLSTRPDYINEEILDILKNYNVTSIELGAQSMDNSVLELNKRGHSAGDVVYASNLIQSFGFSLGLQMMTGLYGSTFEKDMDTAGQLIKLRPRTVRIYPTVIMKNTRLGELYQAGKLKPYTLEQSVDLCAKLMMMFEKAGVKVIRLGLHYSDSLVNNSYGDNYHPAFKELCENKLFYDSFLELTESINNKNIVVYIHPKSLSKFTGQKRCNINRLNDLGYEIKFNFDNTLGKYDLRIGVENETEIIGSARV